ncbi:hypothetical protein PTKIN_Ptkin10aG0019200 [Pterospermum kingtungense]
MSPLPIEVLELCNYVSSELNFRDIYGELTELKKTLNVEVEQLRTEFQELRSTLHQQQEDVTASLRNLGLQDVSEGNKAAEDTKVEAKGEEVHSSLVKENGKEVEK